MKWLTALRPNQLIAKIPTAPGHAGEVLSVVGELAKRQCSAVKPAIMSNGRITDGTQQTFPIGEAES